MAANLLPHLADILPCCGMSLIIVVSVCVCAFHQSTLGALV